MELTGWEPELIEYVTEPVARPEWPEQLVIVRHGHTEQNLAFELYEENGLKEKLEKLANVRDADIALTEKGVWQAEETGKLLANLPRFDFCFATPYRRARQTAEIIMQKLPYNLEVWEDARIREKEYGILNHMATDDIEKIHPDEFNGWNKLGKYWHRPRGGENYPDVKDRVYEFIAKLRRDFEGKRGLIVTHHVPYVLFRDIFEHLGEKGVLALGITPNCGIQEYVLDAEKGKMKLKEFNKVAYRNAGDE